MTTDRASQPASDSARSAAVQTLAHQLISPELDAQLTRLAELVDKLGSSDRLLDMTFKYAYERGLMDGRESVLASYRKPETQRRPKAPHLTLVRLRRCRARGSSL